MAKKTLILLFYIIALTTVGCRNDINLNNSDLRKIGITKQDAQTFFQNKFSSIVTRGSICESDHKLLVPEDYTPIWENTQISENNDQWICETPILSSQGVWAHRHDNMGEYNIRTTQKLVIIKSKADSSMSAYIMTIVPDRKYVGRNINDIYTHSSAKKFSGVVLYSSLTRQLVRISSYNEGKYCIGVYMNENIPLNERVSIRDFIMLGTDLMEYDAATRGGGATMVYENGEWIVYCPYCRGAGCSECSVYVEPERCEKCGEYLNMCQCDKNDGGSDGAGNTPAPDPDPDPMPNSGNQGSNNNNGNESGNNAPIIPVTSNVQLNDAKNFIYSKLIGTELLNSIRNININIQTKCNIDNAAKARMERRGDTVAVMIQINDDIWSQMSERGTIIVLLHELYHIYDYYNNDANNEVSHDHMINDPEYRHYIEMLFPGESDDYYNKMVYAGASPSSEYDNLSPAQKEDLRNFFDNNGIW